MKEQFFGLAARLEKALHAGETLLCNLSGERSDFVRFNKALVRQAGSVEQSYLSLRLVRERRQASASIALAGNGDDLALASATLGRLRDALGDLPADPWLLINETPQSSTTERHGTVLPAQEVLEQALRFAKGRDLVGFYAGGTIYRGFANSLGQRNWHEVDSYNFDWSIYRQTDQAVKTSYAGFGWSPVEFPPRCSAPPSRSSCSRSRCARSSPGSIGRISRRARSSTSWGCFRGAASRRARGRRSRARCFACRKAARSRRR